MLQHFLLLLSLSTTCHGILNVIGREQSVSVTGRLICNGVPAAGVKVKLYDKDVITLDNLLDEEYTNRNGEFHVQGDRREISDINPKVNFYHTCNYGGMCYRKFSIYVPHQYISQGENPYKNYDVGTLNLENHWSGETIDCLN